MLTGSRTPGAPGARARGAGALRAGLLPVAVALVASGCARAGSSSDAGSLAGTSAHASSVASRGGAAASASAGSAASAGSGSLRPSTATFDDPPYHLQRFAAGPAADGTWEATAELRNGGAGSVAGTFHVSVERGGAPVTTLVGVLPVTGPGTVGTVVLRSADRWSAGGYAYDLEPGGTGF